MTYECAGPRVYSYEQLLRAVAHEAPASPHSFPSHLPLGTRWLGSQKCSRARPSLGIKWN